MNKSYYIYIITNKNNTTLYTGVTSNMNKRMYEHKHKIYPNSFTSRYNLNKLVYFGEFNDINVAISREKQIKSGNRKRKIELIETINKNWTDLTYNFNL